MVEPSRAIDEVRCRVTAADTLLAAGWALPVIAPTVRELFVRAIAFLDDAEVAS